MDALQFGAASANETARSAVSASIVKKRMSPSLIVHLLAATLNLRNDRPMAFATANRLIDWLTI
jgi:hypothetical protein